MLGLLRGFDLADRVCSIFEVTAEDLQQLASLEFEINKMNSERTEGGGTDG